MGGKFPPKRCLDKTLPGVEGIKALSQGLGDGPCLAAVEQDWEDVSPVEVHLGSCINMGPPDTLFKEAEACTLLRSRCVALAISQPHFPRRVRSASQGRYTRPPSRRSLLPPGWSDEVPRHAGSLFSTNLFGGLKVPLHPVVLAVLPPGPPAFLEYAVQFYISTMETEFSILQFTNRGIVQKRMLHIFSHSPSRLLVVVGYASFCGNTSTTDQNTCKYTCHYGGRSCGSVPMFSSYLTTF